MRVVFHIVALLALALIVGSIAFFGFGVAGVVFDASILSSRTIAGALNATIVGRLTLLTTVCALVATGMLLPLAVKDRTPLLWGSLIFSMAASVMVLFLGTTLYPEIEELRRNIGEFDRILSEKDQLRAEFAALHERYSFLMKMVWSAALAALIGMAVRLGWAVERGRRAELQRREERRIEREKAAVKTTNEDVGSAATTVASTQPSSTIPSEPKTTAETQTNTKSNASPSTKGVDAEVTSTGERVTTTKSADASRHV